MKIGNLYKNPNNCEIFLILAIGSKCAPEVRNNVVEYVKVPCFVVLDVSNGIVRKFVPSSITRSWELL